jgi:hypothetical protein
MADRDADALEAPVLEIQELGLTRQQALAAGSMQIRRPPGACFVSSAASRLEIGGYHHGP